MRKFFRRYLPDAATLQSRFKLRGLQHPNLWHIHRRSVAGGVAVGLFCGLIPGPLQMIAATVGAVVWRVNLPVAVLTTLYTNPLTIVPLYWLAYQIGAWASGIHPVYPVIALALPTLHWHDWFGVLTQWLMQFGKPLLIGLPILGGGLAISGYVLVRLTWRAWVMWQWHQRKQRRQSGT